MIELLQGSMDADVPWFPCWGISFDKANSSTSEIVEKFLEIRPNSRWVLISINSAASERHLWSAWYTMEQLFFQKSALSKNPDAEFIRIISGTHQLKTAFSRAGLNKNDSEAWLAFLPESNGDLNELAEVSSIEFTENAQKIIYILNAKIITKRPEPSKDGLERLGINFEGDSKLINDDIFIGHLARSSISS